MAKGFPAIPTGPPAQGSEKNQAYETVALGGGAPAQQSSRAPKPPTEGLRRYPLDFGIFEEVEIPPIKSRLTWPCMRLPLF
jgi:hypothetical protein